MASSTSELHTRLQDLFQRMARLDKERAGVAEQIARVRGELATVPEPSERAAEKPAEKPAQGVVETTASRRPRLLTFREHLLALIESVPTNAWAMFDLAARLSVSNRKELNNMRALLARMTKDGDIRRIGHGRYQAL